MGIFFNIWYFTQIRRQLVVKSYTLDKDREEHVFCFQLIYNKAFQ